MCVCVYVCVRREDLAVIDVAVINAVCAEYSGIIATIWCLSLLIFFNDYIYLEVFELLGIGGLMIDD